MSADAGLEAFRALVLRRLGLQFGEDRLEILRDALRQGLLEHGQAGLASYLRDLEQDGPALARLTEALTVTETYFFRHGDHFRALAESVLPQRIRARASLRRLRLASVGCASGEEAYSLAMQLRQQPGLEGWDLEVLGVDFNGAALERARRALYGPWSMRDTPEALRERHFVRRGKDFEVVEPVRALVRFERRNLAEPNGDLWRSGAFDAVFCRNMLMYFGPAEAGALVERLAGALAPDGFLFLGSAETLRGLSQSFHLCHTHDTFYYRRAEGRPAPAAAPDALRPEPLLSAADLSPDLTWMEAIQGASERIAGLAARSAGGGTGGARTPAPVAGLQRALELLERERYGEALAALPADPDLDGRLLRAVLLLNMGRPAEAEEDCRGLLASDELNAGAHYLTALCREQAGDDAAAEASDRTALYLDPGFALPWMHVGRLARRGGRPAEARRHWAQALSLLAMEDSSRVLLFGGGFGREGLMQLCRASLRSLEDQP